MLVVEREKSTTKWPAEAQMDWQTAGELVQTTQYDQDAKLLHQAPLANIQGGQPTQADLLALFGQIWLAVSQAQSEIAQHQQACTQASRQEQELKQLLLAILALLDQSAMPELKPGSTPLLPISISQGSLAAANPPGLPLYTSLRQHVQSLLDRSAEAQPVVENVIPPTALPRVVEPAPAQPGSAALVIRCLGPFRVYLNGQPVTGWNGLKSQGVLKYLVAHHGTPTSKDFLMGLFWPEADLKAARRNLHQAIYSLRQTLERSHKEVQPIQFENNCYFLNPALTLWLDYTEFERHAQAGRRLEAVGQRAAAMAEYSQAEALYQGDFLEEDLYEDWVNWPRERLHQTYLDLADRLSEDYLQQGEIKLSIALCQKILKRDNCFEQAHRRLMACYHSQGQSNQAIRQYQSCLRILKTELDLPPSAETQALYEKITRRAGSLELAY